MSGQPIIAMVHYHLRRGGVTRVIQNAVEALSGEAVTCVVVTGEEPPQKDVMNVPMAQVEGLGYDEQGAGPDPDALLERVRRAVRKVVGRSPDVWHIHNHALGKNPQWTRAVSRMAAEGESLLLQIHDFAEDGRPDNYRHLLGALGPANDHDLGRTLYPPQANVHYAVLNNRDLQIMRKAGVAEERIQLLPNAVWTGESKTATRLEPDRSKPLYLYPTRAIRRKNVGEFLLWSAMDSGEGRYGITLAPQSKLEIPHYERWQAFADAQGLPVEFEMGMRHDFQDLLAAADALVTTSIAEGFGLAFLEPWLADRMVIGRNLPEITQEFVEAGVVLDALYEQLSVPADWIDADALKSRIGEKLGASYEAYGRRATPTDAEVAYHAAVSGARVEFSRLDESFQETVISRLRSSSEACSEVRPARLVDLAQLDVDRIQTNKERVAEKFGLDQYRERLMRLYEGVMNSRAEDEPIAAGAVLDQFLAPERFYLLRA